VGTEGPELLAFAGPTLIAGLVLLLLCAIASTHRLPPQLPRAAFFVLAVTAAPIIFWGVSWSLNPLVLSGGIKTAVATFLMLANFVSVLVGFPLLLSLAASRLLPLVPLQVLSTTIRVLAVAFLVPYLWLAFGR